MSRIGKLPIAIPQGIEVNVSEQNVVSVKGPKGTLHQKVDADIHVKQEEGSIIVERPTDQKRHRAMHGLYRSLINNMVIGVSEGYKIELEMIGVGYRASAHGQQLELSVGYSHPVIFVVPTELKLSVITEKGKSTTNCS